MASDLLDQNATFGEAHAGAAIFLRDKRAEPAAFRHGGTKLDRPFAFLFFLAPIDIVERLLVQEIHDGGLQNFLVLTELEIHAVLPSLIQTTPESLSRARAGAS